jgi:hypothetical protein
MIGASRRGFDILSDGCGYTYGFKRDYPNFRVWRCTFHVGVELSRCNATLKQIKRPGVDCRGTYSQEDFTLSAEKAHSHPPDYDIEKRQLVSRVRERTGDQSSSAIILGHISTAESARVSADVGVSIDYQDTRISNSEVANAKRKRCPGQRQANKKQRIINSAFHYRTQSSRSITQSGYFRYSIPKTPIWRYWVDFCDFI